MATGTETGSSGIDVIFGAARDTLSAYIDIVKGRHDADTYTRILRAEGEQQRLLTTPEVPFQNRGGAADVRMSAATPMSFSIPPAAMWVGGGLLALGLGALVYKLVK